MYYHQQENTIINVQIHKGEFLKVKFNQSIPGGKDKTSRECGSRIHPDLVEAFGKLDEHLANLTFQRNSEGAIDYAAVHCSGYELDLKDENGIKVKLSGRRHLQSNKTLELVSPKQNILETGIEIYEYDGREELDKALQACDEEVRAYLFEGKHAEEPQISIDLDTEEMPKKKLSKKARLALEAGEDGRTGSSQQASEASGREITGSHQRYSRDSSCGQHSIANHQW